MTEWTPYLEWTLNNLTFDTNPYDLDASVEFIHRDSGAQIRTGMYYSGNGKWKFRFTGTSPGRWDFITSSSDFDLDGKRGRVLVERNPNTPGFIVASGNKWMKQGIDKTFVPQIVMYADPDRYYQNPDKIDADIELFFGRHGFNGLHTMVFCRWFDFNQERSQHIDDADPNPDQRTFEALELLIMKVHAAGGARPYLAWGDESRHQTPGKWGVNGRADKRLQRYIAARLGPLPGWTMGYGFDLYEWVNQEQLDQWYLYLHSFMGWQHMLGARSHKNKLNQLSELMDYSSYEQHCPDYDKYLETISRRPDKPSFSEDRFRFRNPSPYPEKDYDLDMVRKGLWHSTMAGGVANIWGYLPDSRSDSEGSAPFPNADQIKTYATFISRAFTDNLKPCKGDVAVLCLEDDRSKRRLYFAENKSRVFWGI